LNAVAGGVVHWLTELVKGWFVAGSSFTRRSVERCDREDGSLRIVAEKRAERSRKRWQVD
jgi:hypothetical protein